MSKNYDFRVRCTGYNANEKYFTIGKVYSVKDGVIVSDNGFEYESWAFNNSGDFDGLQKWFKGCYEFELVEVSDMKFKVGDKVKVVDTTNVGKMKYIGEVFTIRELNPNGLKFVGTSHYGVKESCPYIWFNYELELATPAKQPKIVITTDGKTTTATRYNGDGTKDVGVAVCHPDDKFDFMSGVKIAMDHMPGNKKEVEKVRVDIDAPLTNEQLMKMDGMKVWLSSLLAGKEVFDDKYCGWHTVSVEKQRLIDENTGFYRFSSNGDPNGFRAYLRPQNQKNQKN